MEGTVTITKNKYLRLILAEEELTRLEAGGVDNWEWFGEALYPDNQPDLDTFEENETKRIEAL